MDPGTAQVVSSLILGGLSFAGGALQGQPQQMETFADGSETDPNNMIKSVFDTLKGAYGDAKARAERPVELPSSYVQDVPTFTGGGLPMPIGVTGHDPALKNHELQRITKDGQIGGYDPSDSAFFPDNSFLPGRGPSDNRGGPLDDAVPASDMLGNDLPGGTKLPGYRSLSGGIARRPLGSGGQDLLGMNGTGLSPDEFTQAHGAVDLLMHALGQ